MSSVSVLYFHYFWLAHNSVNLHALGLESCHFFNENQHLLLCDIAFSAATELFEALQKVGFEVFRRLTHLHKCVTDKASGPLKIESTITIAVKHLPNVIDSSPEDSVYVFVDFLLDFLLCLARVGQLVWTVLAHEAFVAWASKRRVHFEINFISFYFIT